MAIINKLLKITPYYNTVKILINLVKPQSLIPHNFMINSEIPSARC